MWFGKNNQRTYNRACDKSRLILCCVSGVWRNESSPTAVFRWKKLDDDGVNELRQSVAENLCYLVERYRRNKKHRPAVTMSVLLKLAGWNVLQAAGSRAFMLVLAKRGRVGETGSSYGEQAAHMAT